MKVTYGDIKSRLTDLSWNADELADKLSAIGHETEVSEGHRLDVTLTNNRKDCQDLNYLVFDLAGVYGLTPAKKLIEIKLAQPIPVTASDINKLLGSSINLGEMKQLERLGFAVSETTVTPPAFRDVHTVADVAEEVVRIIGFEQVSRQLLSKEEAPDSAEYGHILAVKRALFGLGLTETATSSFAPDGKVELKNPFTTTEPFLRPNLQLGLLRTLAKNPYLKRTAFFEIGQTFDPAESTQLGIILAGYKNWSEWETRINQALNTTLHFAPVNQQVAEKTDVKQGQLYWAEVELGKLKLNNPETTTIPLPSQFRPISKYPPLVRDFNIYKPILTLEEIKSRAETTFGDQLLLLEEIDRYGEMSTIRFFFQKMTASFSQEEIDRLSTEVADFLKPIGADKI